MLRLRTPGLWVTGCALVGAGCSAKSFHSKSYQQHPQRTQRQEPLDATNCTQSRLCWRGIHAFESGSALPAPSHWIHRIWTDAGRRLVTSQENMVLAEQLSPNNSASKSTAKLPAHFVKAFKELKNLLEDRFSTDPGDLEERSLELSGYSVPREPDCVVWPLTTNEVSQILKICNRYGIPVVPYGAATSVEGHINMLKGGVCLDMKRMNNILDINVADEDVVVEAGISWPDLNAALEPHGYFVSSDPGPGACVGGMCGTGCSGTNAVRYGTMKDQVINLTAVLADGTVFKTRRRARKSSAGYDLARLVVGSEGTLAVVTEATLKMRPIPKHLEVSLVEFKSVTDAVDSVIDILREGIQMGAIEFLDEPMLKAVKSYSSLPKLPCERPVLLLKFSGHHGDQVKRDVEAVKKIVGKHDVHAFHWFETEEEKDTIWEARKQAFWAAGSQYPDKRLMCTDVAVPISRLSEIIGIVKSELQRRGIYGPIVGHVGDGNFHVCMCVDPENSAEMAKAVALNEFMVWKAIDMDGTCTGEHGIGLGKKKYLDKELGKSTVEVMRRLKAALDPHGILNPGKIFDMPTEKK